MSVLITKSKDNITSAELLIDNNFYISSVHCSYYSSFQLMSYLLLNKYNFTKDTLDEAANKEKGSHIFVQNYIHTKMRDKNIRFKAVEFQRTIGDLKNKRHKADYQEIIIEDEEGFGKEALVQAKRINEILTEIFEIE